MFFNLSFTVRGFLLNFATTGNSKTDKRSNKTSLSGFRGGKGERGKGKGKEKKGKGKGKGKGERERGKGRERRVRSGKSIVRSIFHFLPLPFPFPFLSKSTSTYPSLKSIFGTCFLRSVSPDAPAAPWGGEEVVPEELSGGGRLVCFLI